MTEVNTTREQHFKELSHALKKAGFQVKARDGDVLPVFYEDKPLCQATEHGIRYRKDDVDSSKREAARDKVATIVSVVNDYTAAVMSAPFLKASGLDERFNCLADFGGVVLAGQLQPEGGAQFVTWNWDYNREGVSHGHYYENDYAAAKEDFAVRSGLIPKAKLFTPDQFAVLHLCIEDGLNYGLDISDEQEQLLRSAKDQIEALIPDKMEMLTTEQGLHSPLQTM